MTSTKNVSMPRIATAVEQLEADQRSNVRVFNDHQRQLDELKNKQKDIIAKNEQVNNSRIQNIEMSFNSLSKKLDAHKDNVLTAVEDKIEVLKGNVSGEVSTLVKDEINDRIGTIEKKIVEATNGAIKDVLIELDDEDIQERSTDHILKQAIVKHDIETNQDYSAMSIVEDVSDVKIGKSSNISVTIDDDQKESVIIKSDLGGVTFEDSYNNRWGFEHEGGSLNIVNNDVVRASIGENGLNVDSVTINGSSIVGVDKKIKSGEVKQDRVPSTAAVVGYINKVLPLVALKNTFESKSVNDNITDVKTTDEQINNELDNSQNARCQIAILETSDSKSSLYIQNEDESISLNAIDEEEPLKLQLSKSQGLVIKPLTNNTPIFSLTNNSTTLCYMTISDGTESSDNIQSISPLHRFVEITGKVIKVDDNLYAHEIALTQSLSAATFGIVNEELTNIFTRNGKTYTLPTKAFNKEVKYFGVVQSGIISIPAPDGTYDLGTILIAGKNGELTVSSMHDEALMFCSKNRVPCAKILASHHSSLILQVVI